MLLASPNARLIRGVQRLVTVSGQAATATGRGGTGGATGGQGTTSTIARLVIDYDLTGPGKKFAYGTNANTTVTSYTADGAAADPAA